MPLRLPRGRWFVAAVVLALALLVTYFAWFRDSSLVAVERVSVSGLSGPYANELRGRLIARARRMTTLDTDSAALRRAVAGLRVVRSLSVEPGFPHGLKINLVLYVPVAALTEGQRELAVAGDGTLLPTLDPGPLPRIAVGQLPRGARVEGRGALDLAAVAGGAPAPLRPYITSFSRSGSEGIVARLRGGSRLIFGDAREVGRKWVAAAAVLAQRSSAGATYIDVRDPRRPLEGGVGIPDAPQPTVAPNPSDPAAPGTIPAPASPGQSQGQPITPATAGPASAPAPSPSANPRP